MSKGVGRKQDPQKVMQVVAAMFVLAGVAIETHWTFKGWWSVMGSWAEENPLGALVMLLLLLSPVLLALKVVAHSGRRLGEEAEEIGRGMYR